MSNFWIELISFFISFEFECFYGCCHMEWESNVKKKERFKKKSEMKNGCLKHICRCLWSSDNPKRWTHATKQSLIALETRNLPLIEAPYTKSRIGSYCFIFRWNWMLRKEMKRLRGRWIQYEIGLPLSRR